MTAKRRSSHTASSDSDLTRLHPKADLRLVLIDYQETRAKELRAQASGLMYPLTTQMDLSISVVLKMASIGVGVLGETGQCYKVQAKALLSGLGADEYFGGYSRYRVAFLRGGYPEMLEEMRLDQNRLWVRNMGRDDRVIASEGRELRTPFLTQALARLANSIPPELLAKFKGPGTDGGSWRTKLVLRRLARHLGLVLAADLPKKAIQFGTGIAKEHNKALFGSNRKGKGQMRVTGEDD